MVIKPVGRPRRKRSRRIAAHENKIPKKRGLPLKRQPVTGRALNALRAALCTLAHGLKAKPQQKRTVHTKRGFRITKKVWFTVIFSCLAISAVIMVIALLSPGGKAATAPGLLSSNGDGYVAANITSFPAYQIPAPAATPVPVSNPDPRPSAAATPQPEKSHAEATPQPARKTAPPPSTPDIDTLVAFFRVEADSYYSDFNYSSNHYDYTEDELQMMAKIIQAEAGGEPYEGKLAIGNVVINRTLCGHWGSTMADQTKGLAYNPDKVPSAASLAAARAVLDYEVWVVPQNTYNFKNSGGDWRTFTYWGQIGHHYFYTYHYGTRCDKSTVPPALYKRVYKYAQYGCKPAERVKRLQFMLKSLGYKVNPDGYFGEGTEKALIEFQQAKGLKADGVAGPATVKALIRAFGVKDYCKKYL